MENRGLWWTHLRRAAAESSDPVRNWWWMLASLGIGGGLGLVAGLQRLGLKPARITQEVAVTAVRAALFVFVSAWLATVAIRFGRSLLSGRR
jgi:hypothetical protein